MLFAAIILADVIAEGVTMCIGAGMYIYGHQLSNPKEDETPERAAKRERAGRILRIGGPLVILGGVLKLISRAITEG